MGPTRATFSLAVSFPSLPASGVGWGGVDGRQLFGLFERLGRGRRRQLKERRGSGSSAAARASAAFFCHRSRLLCLAFHRFMFKTTGPWKFHALLLASGEMDTLYSVGGSFFFLLPRLIRSFPRYSNFVLPSA